MMKRYTMFALAAVVYTAFAVYLYQPYFNGFGSLRLQDMFVANICFACLGAYVLSRRWIAGFAESFFAGAVYGFGPFAIGLVKFHPTAVFLFAAVPWLFCPAVFGPSPREMMAFPISRGKGKFKPLRVPLSLLPFLAIVLFFQLAGRFGLYPIPINLKLHGAEMTGLLAPLVAAKRNMTSVGFYHIPLASLIMGLSMFLVPLEGLGKGGILHRGKILRGLAVRRLGIVIIFVVSTILSFCDSLLQVSPIIWLAISMLCCSILIGVGMQGFISAGFADRKWILFAVVVMGILAIVTLLFATKYFQVFAGLGSVYARLLTEEAKMYILGAITAGIIFFYTRAKFRMQRSFKLKVLSLKLEMALLCGTMGLDIFLGARFVIDTIL
jgi:hypothetical protein